MFIVYYIIKKHEQLFKLFKYKKNNYNILNLCRYRLLKINNVNVNVIWLHRYNCFVFHKSPIITMANI